MQIKHHFADEVEAIKLFDGTEKFSQFKSKLKKLSKELPRTNPIRWGRSVKMESNINTILGDGFELFCELLVLHVGKHPHIGLANYEPVCIDEDEGVDAYAVNLNLEKSAVQCKFVSDVTYKFTANGSNLSNFLVEAGFNEVSYAEESKIKRMFLITTASGLHYHTKEKWRDRLHVINNKVIEQIVNNNKIFWKACVEILKGEHKNG